MKNSPEESGICYVPFWFGNALALDSSMTFRKKEREEEWRKLCELVADEPDPQRLSELVDQLIEKLDARRQALGAAKAST
jgi:hypothetical protein